MISSRSITEMRDPSCSGVTSISTVEGGPSGGAYQTNRSRRGASTSSTTPWRSPPSSPTTRTGAPGVGSSSTSFREPLLEVLGLGHQLPGPLGVDRDGDLSLDRAFVRHRSSSDVQPKGCESAGNQR